MNQQQRYSSSLLGSFVADAAALGLHWIYDVERIAQIVEQTGHSAFVAINAQHYQDVAAYFAHAKRADGMLTQYGETLRIALHSMIARDGQFEVADYQQRFADHFGAGGNYQGYIDRPTRGTLDNIANKVLQSSGIDDDQHPALATIPAIAVAYTDADDFANRVEQAVRVSNDNDIAVAYSQIFADLLARVLQGEALQAALLAVTENAKASIKVRLTDALNSVDDSAVSYGEVTGRACHLPMGLPLCFHILARASSYREAVERNILAGGDSAGRGIVIGAVMGAIHGIEGKQGIPLEWILQLSDGSSLWRDCLLLSAKKLSEKQL